MTIAMASARVRPHWVQCADCKWWFDPYDNPTTPAETVCDSFDGGVICPNCINRRGFAFCSDCDEIFDKTDLVDCSEYSSAPYTRCIKIFRCEDCAEDAGWIRCEHCNTLLHPDNQLTSPGCETYCSDCFNEYFHHCAGCEEIFDTDNMYAHDCELWCESCYERNAHSSDGDNFGPSGFRNRSGCTTKMGSERCYGLELETDSCDGYNNLDDSGAWGAKDDGTISGKEIYSTILDGDEGLDAIARFAAFADENDWEVAHDCGYHLHIDMRQENEDSLFAAAYAYRATQTVWHAFVSAGRRENTYCHTARWTCNDLTSYDGFFRYFASDYTRDRYEWLNLRAYNDHATFEVRLHHASLNRDEICNWVKAHTRFVDWATTLGYDEVKERLAGKTPQEQFDLIACEAWQDKELRDYYAEKAFSAGLVGAVAR